MPKGTPAVIQAGEYARSLGLSVRENPYWDKVDPVHVKGSDHYDTLGTYKGKPYGAAIDVSGSPQKMAAYFKWVEARRKALGLKDEFYDPMGYSYDEGNYWKHTIGGHGDHVHASFR
jgi:hypothetical protein